MTPLAAAMFTPGHKLPEPAPDAGGEYDFPLFKAFAVVRQHKARSAQDAAEAEREVDSLLLKEVPEAKPPLPTALQSMRDWERCERLIERCRTLRDSDPDTRVMLGLLAVTWAGRLQPGEAGPQALADLQARAWAELGNARRVGDDPLGAERDLAQAVKAAGRGTGNPLLLARIMDLTASLYTDQRRFREAFQLLDWVYLIYRVQGETHAAGRALISKAISTSYALDPQAAVNLLSQGLTLIDARQDPRLVLAAVHDLISCLVDFERYGQAHALIEGSRLLYSFYGSAEDGLKVAWLEGRIAAGLHQEERAEQLFREVQQGFFAMERPCTAAVASLDLAALWLERGRTAEISRLVDETVAIFRARSIRTEAVAALLVLSEALQKQQATAALLRTVASEVQRVEREPVRLGRPAKA